MTSPQMPPARRREHRDRPLPHDEQVPGPRPSAAGCTCRHTFVQVRPGMVQAKRTPDPDCPEH